MFRFILFAFNVTSFAYACRNAGANIDAQIRRRTNAGKGGKGKASDSTDVVVTLAPEVNQVVGPAGSNDGSYLEHICGLYTEFLSKANNTCDSFQRFGNIMCPNDYELQKICTTSSYSDLSEAVVGGFCEPLFVPLVDVPEQQVLCADLCKSFAVDTHCCNISCRGTITFLLVEDAE